MRGNSHVRFGGRAEETDRPKGRHRASVRPNHAFASMLISAGCSVKAVSRALGHSSAATTLNLYSHLWPGDEDRIRDAVDLALGPRAEDRLRTVGKQ